jgi:glutathione S-transferase
MTMSKTEAWFQTASDSTVTVRFSKDEDAPPRFHVGYWSIRGLCAPLRMMLCAARADFVCHMYDIQEDSDAKAGWVTGYFKEKAENLLQYNPFMNLPYVADQQEKLVVTQSNACLQYLGDQLGMMGQTAAEHTFCVQLLCEVYDLRDAMVKHAYGSPADTAEAAVQTAQKHFAKFDKHLETKDNKCFLIGDSFTAPDFHLFEMIDQFDQLCKTNEFEDCLAEYPHVRAFYTAFAQLEYVVSKVR